MMRKTLGVLALCLGLGETACVVPAGNVGDLPGGSGTDDAGASDDSGSSGDGESADGMVDGTSSGGEVPSACGPEGPSCQEDQDGDCVALAEDNAPDVYNPSQSDLDGDDVADEIDACPTLAGDGPVTGDTDRDGIGNDCDPCRKVAEQYENDALPILGYMRVRNVPSVADSDGDGIGDACDNCVVVPNCDGFGPEDPWMPGEPIADDDPALCQTDSDADMVGDACAGLWGPNAAGPVGLGPDDDFDQDGLANVVDACARLPLTELLACADDGDCPDGRRCEVGMGLCDHLDHDADGVGDRCDTCPGTPNPMQVADGAMQEGDDTDGDFVGNACELGAVCETRSSPRRTGYYPVAVGGQCCTVAYRGDGSILDPDGVPLRRDCPGDGIECRTMPLAIEQVPGLVELPLGCDAALADAGLTVETHVPLGPDDVGGLEQLWAYACQLPPLDQDFDGLGDQCDLCPFDFDPENLPYIDESGQVWPNDGKYCNGAYSVDNCGG